MTDTETEETYLGQVWGSYPEGTPERWLDYARGKRDESKRWFEQRPAGTARVVHWISREVIWPEEEEVPVPDDPILRELMRTAANLWSGEEMPDWRENEYARGQVETIVEICRVVTDEEYEGGYVEGEVLKDRVWHWIKAKKFDGPDLLTEDEWKLTPEYQDSGDWGGDINERRPVLVMWGDPTETPTQAVGRLNAEAVTNAAASANRRRLLLDVVKLFTEQGTKPLIDDAAGVDQDHVKMYASPEWYQSYLALLAKIREEIKP